MDSFEMVFDESAEDGLSHIMQKGGGELDRGFFLLQPFGQNLRQNGAGYGMTPEFTPLQLIPWQDW